MKPYYQDDAVRRHQMTKPFRLTREWAEEHRACPRAQKRFFERWPNGLSLTRRNLYMVARECPASWLDWFGALFLEETRGAEGWQDAYDLARELLLTLPWNYTRSPAKKLEYAKALADKLGLP